MRVIEQHGFGDWVTTRHAADLFGVKQPAIERCIQRKNLVVCAVGRTYLVRLADLAALGMRPVQRLSDQQGDCE